MIIEKRPFTKHNAMAPQRPATHYTSSHHYHSRISPGGNQKNKLWRMILYAAATIAFLVHVTRHESAMAPIVDDDRDDDSFGRTDQPPKTKLRSRHAIVQESIDMTAPYSNKQQQQAKSEAAGDNHPQCAYWADSGECERNPDYMLAKCAEACKNKQKSKGKATQKELPSGSYLHHCKNCKITDELVDGRYKKIMQCTCKDSSGVSKESNKIAVDTCEEFANSNGKLVCDTPEPTPEKTDPTAPSNKEAEKQSDLPPGSYSHHCKNCKIVEEVVDGSYKKMLKCTCKDGSGVNRETNKIAVDACEEFANSHGTLVCDTPGLKPEGVASVVGEAKRLKLPSGTYSDHCKDCKILEVEVDGSVKNMMQCTCKDSMGVERKTNRIAIDACEEFGNSDGKLVCDTSDGFVEVDEKELPPGTYLKHCTKCKIAKDEVDGTVKKMLRCTCKNGAGKNIETNKIAVDACEEFANDHGRLVCDIMHVHPENIPEGTYKDSCRECQFLENGEDTVLSCAACKDGKGGTAASTIKIDHIKGCKVIGNEAGVLMCEDEKIAANRKLEEGKELEANKRREDLERETAGRAEVDTRYLRPRPIVFAGPSGVGKGTLINMLLEHFTKNNDGDTTKGGKFFGFSVSHTTRKPRTGEVEGEHYHFTEMDKIKTEIGEGKFIEHAEVHGNIYGTSFEAVESVTRSGRICILDIDIQGVKGVKNSHLDPHYIFIAPPSMKELEQRLRDRGTEKEEDILIRTQNAGQEVEYGREPGNFDAIVVNGDKDAAFRELIGLLESWYPHLKGFSR